MASNISSLASADLDPQYFAKLFAYVFVTGSAMAQGALVNKVGGAAASGFVTGGLGLVLKRALVMSAPLPIKIASGVLVGMNWAVRSPLGGVMFFGPETFKRLVQYFGSGTGGALPEITAPTDLKVFDLPGTTVIEKVPPSLGTSDTLSYIFKGAAVGLGLAVGTYAIYKIYQKWNEPDED
ncbi:MAG TPA: hypothetical protein VGG85_03705 [Terracidiphilus sp.]|jgi:hypothetical protein